jgi:hypothetical protein
MEGNGHTTRTARAFALAVVTATVLVAGCGSSNDYKNKLKPPEPINVVANVSNTRVLVSPDAVGAGPIVLIITNQTSHQQDVTLKTAALNGKPGVKQSTGPIVPRGGTAQLQVNVTEGKYRLSANDDSVEPATIAVGSERPSAQDELLQP